MTEDVAYWKRRALASEAEAEDWERKARAAYVDVERLSAAVKQRLSVGIARVIASGGTNDHPCPAETSWFASSDEENYSVGPFETQAGCAAEAQSHADDDGRPYFVAECQPNHINLSAWFDAEAWLERIGEDMEDENGADENGDNHPLEEITTALAIDLQASVRSAIWHWQNRKGLRLKAYWFARCRVAQVVQPRPEEGDE